LANPWKLDTEALDLLAAADKVAAQSLTRHAAEVDRDGRFPQENLDALREAGLLRLVAGKDAGGHGQGLRAASAIADRLARECPSTAMIWIMHVCATAVLDRHGTPELRRAAADGKLATLAFSEAGSRSHFWVPVSTAERTSSGVKLNASKQLITSAGRCDLYVWSSRPAAAEGLSSIWAVPANALGLSIPRPFDGLGLRGNGSAPIAAKDVVIPASNLLGEDGKGFDVMMGVVMPFFSLQNCAVSLGMCEGVFARTISHVTATKYAYDGSRLCDLVQVRGHLARMRVKLDLLRGFLQDAVDAVEGGREDAMLRVLEAKVVGSETSLEVHDLAMRVAGGAGFRKDVGIDRYFRDSRAATVMAPVSDALYEFIGKAVCGIPVFG